MPARRRREHVDWTLDGGVATVVISNGPLNVLSGGVLADLGACAGELEADASVRVVVLTGAGDRAFVAGGDIREFPEILRQGGGSLFTSRTRGPFEAFAALPQPTIAAVNGLAYGGGTELALLCDLRIAGENVKFCLPEIKIGLFPAGGGTQRLPRLVGKPKAKELMFLGEPISAQEALRIGLVNRVVPAGQVLAAARELAHQLATRPAVALRAIKRVVDEGCAVDLSEGLAVEARLFEEVFDSADAKEGIAAFLEKRPPVFRYR